MREKKNKKNEQKLRLFVKQEEQLESPSEEEKTNPSPPRQVNKEAESNVYASALF